MVESKHKWKAWLYLAPAIVLLLVFTVWPIINTVRIAFLDGYSLVKDLNPETTYNFGIQNFLLVLDEYSGFKQAVINTLILTFATVPLSTFLALLIAVCLNSIKPFARLLQTIYFLPYVTNSIAIGMVFMAMFNYVGYGGHEEFASPGVVNAVLEFLDLDAFVNLICDGIPSSFFENMAEDIKTLADTGVPFKVFVSNVLVEVYHMLDALPKGIAPGFWSNFLSNMQVTIDTLAASEVASEVFWSKVLDVIYHFVDFKAISWINADSSYWSNMFVLIVYIVWNALPFKILILLGGLQSVNKQYYDAAKIDSTPRARVFTRITVPLLSPMLSYVVITGFIGGFKEYSSVVGIFGEEMMCYDNDLGTMVGYINKALMTPPGQEGAASAGALILFVLIFAVTMVNLYVSKKNTHY